MKSRSDNKGSNRGPNRSSPRAGGRGFGQDNDRTPRQKDTLRSLDVRPSKERGQNFLIREEVPEQIVSFGNLSPDACVLEIGPGTGALTKHLSAWKNLTVIEIEERFCPPLSAAYPHIKIINEDVRKVDLATLLADTSPLQRFIVFGNIPYSFSSEIVFHLLKHRASVEYAVLMTQREFAERIAAAHGSRSYGSLSVAVQLWADVTLGPVVPGDSFHPPTKVESQVVRLTFRDTPRVAVEDFEHFERVVRASFSQRRKKLTNSLAASSRWTKEEVEAALKKLNIRPDARPEQLSVEEFGGLAMLLAP